MKFIHILLLLIVISILPGCDNRNLRNQINEEKAKEIAINTAYGDNQYLIDIANRQMSFLIYRSKEMAISSFKFVI